MPGTRGGGSAGSDPSWYALDTLTIKLSYFEQKEDYKLILVNNSMTTQDYKTLGGATSTGDFGSMMREIFEPATQAKFEWDHWGTLRGRRVLAFSYRVAQFRSQWHINYDRKLDIVPAYKGLVYVDKETHHVLRVTLDAEDIPASFPVRRAETVLDYDFQDISGHTFLLPLKATTIMAASDYMTKNDEEFRVYRKYSAESDIKFDVTDVPAPLTDDKTKETRTDTEEHPREIDDRVIRDDLLRCRSSRVCCGVFDRKRAVSHGGHVEPLAFTDFVEIRDEAVGGVVILAARNGEVQLPDVLQSRGVVQRLPDFGGPPFFAPFSMMAARGASARTSCGEFEVAVPWCDTTKASTVPSLLLGQTSSYSLSEVRSPRSARRKLPNCAMNPTDRPFSVLSASGFLKVRAFRVRLSGAGERRARASHHRRRPRGRRGP